MARFSSSRCALFFVSICSLFLTALPNGKASSEDRLEAGPSAAQVWLAQIDKEEYENCYHSASDAMHDKVPVEKWVAVLRTFRTQWGNVLSRKQISHVYKPNGVEGLKGECMIVTYDTSFQKLDPAQEIVVLHWESGKWRGAGYTAGPKISSDDAAAADDSAGMPQTETSTRTTSKPQQ